MLARGGRLLAVARFNKNIKSRIIKVIQRSMLVQSQRVKVLTIHQSQKNISVMAARIVQHCTLHCCEALANGRKFIALI